MHQSGFRGAVKALEGFFAEFQRLTRELDADEESPEIRIQLGALKRMLSERLPVMCQQIRPEVVELEFWEPGVLSAFDEIWLDWPDRLQGPASWLGYMGRLRRFLLDALKPDPALMTNAPASHRKAVENPLPSVPQLEFPSSGGIQEAERHFTPKELADSWGLDQSTVRRMFRDEEGVLRLPHLGRRGKRDYVTLRIPASVAARVHERRSRSLFKI
jgi:hypothetical protein